MGEMVRGLCQRVVCAVRSKRDLALENAALRQQLMVLRRQSIAPRIEKEEILGAYLIRREQDGGLDELLFPATRGGNDEHMIDNVRKSLDQIGLRAGFERGSLRATAFRHSYATARLYTAQHGAPVSLWTVRGEMGHSSTGMIQKVYGHTITQRTAAWKEQRVALPEVVEFRIENHKNELEDRLLALR